MKKNKFSSGQIMIFVAGALFCLMLISVSLMSGLYARYISTGSGSDTARVIKFGDLTLTETGDFYENNKLMIIPGVDLKKKVVVDFDGSESATYVFVEIVPTKWSTTDNKTFSFLLNGNAAMQWNVSADWSFLKSVDGTYVYYCALAPNIELDTVDVIANNGKITVSNQITKSEIEAMTGISIKLRATVVQAGGFDGPEAAWNSVAAKEG